MKGNVDISDINAKGKIILFLFIALSAIYVFTKARLCYCFTAWVKVSFPLSVEEGKYCLDLGTLPKLC